MELWWKGLNIYIIRVLEGEVKESGDEKCLKHSEHRRFLGKKICETLMTDNFPILAKHIKQHIQEYEWSSNRINPKKFTPRHVIVKPKDRLKQNLEATRMKWHFTYVGKTIWMTADFLWKTKEAERKWHNIFLSVENKNCQPWILHLHYPSRSKPSKLSFKIVGEIKKFSNKRKLGELFAGRSSLKERPKEIF